jgi:predicted transcriptional regulator
MTVDEEILSELRKISKILVFSNYKTIETELSKVVTTNDRKKMWVLIDGECTPKDMAEKIGVTPAAVRYFLRDAKTAGLVDYGESDAPRRILDYVPPEWVALTYPPRELTAEQVKQNSARPEKVIK